MKLHQLRSADAIVKQNLNLTKAAKSLNATQPGVSTHIQLLERELGLELFVRDKNRFVALTPAGDALLPIAAKVVEAVDELNRVAKGIAARPGVALTIATSPTPARLALPQTVERFSRRYPDTKLHLLLGNATQSLEHVKRGEADFCISSAPPDPIADVCFFPCFDVSWQLVVPKGHALAQRKKSLTLADISKHPIITYHEGFTSREIILDAFRAVGLSPNIVFDAGDSDVMKRYIESGVGVGIMGNDATAQSSHAALETIQINSLIPSARIHIGLKRRVPISKFAHHFISLFAPGVSDSIKVYR